MNKIKDSISTSSFGVCPLPITQKIIQESFNPRVREVCKIFNKLFDNRYVNFIIKNLDGHDIKDLTIKELLIAQHNLLPNSNDFINLRNFFYGIRNHSPKSVDISDDIGEGIKIISNIYEKNLNYVLQYDPGSTYYKKIKLCEIIPELRQGLEDANLIHMCCIEDEYVEFRFGIENCITSKNIIYGSENHFLKDLSIWGPKFVEETASHIRNNISSLKQISIDTLFKTFAFGTRQWIYCGTLFFVPKEILNFKNASYINLCNNSLFYVPEQFSEFIDLTHINLENNNIKELNVNFEKLKKLIYLDISKNKIKKLPESITKSVELKDFLADENEIEELPENFGNLKCLMQLTLRKNRLQYLPRSIGELENLVFLDLDHNHLCSVPDSLVKLTALTRLNLSYNNLEKLPEKMGLLKKLQNLDISYNKLTELPSSVVKLTALTRLNLSYNNLEKLPEKMGLLKKLQNLDISYNKLTELPSSLAWLTWLKYLHACGNCDSLSFSGGTLENLSSSLPNLKESYRVFLKPPVIEVPHKRKGDIGDSEKEAPPSKVQRNAN